MTAISRMLELIVTCCARCVAATCRKLRSEQRPSGQCMRFSSGIPPRQLPRFSTVRPRTLRYTATVFLQLLCTKLMAYILAVLQELPCNLRRLVSAGGGLRALVAALAGPELSLSFTAMAVSALKAFLVPSQSAVPVCTFGSFPSLNVHSVSNVLLLASGMFLLCGKGALYGNTVCRVAGYAAE